MKSRVRMVLAAAVVLGAVWAQALVVCRSCGREGEEGATVCAHCDAKLPPPRKKAPEPVAAPVAAAVDTDKEVAEGAAALVEANVRTAREQEGRQPAVALCYYQNALALMRLVPAGRFPASVNELILKGNENLLKGLLVGRVQCRLCSGSGKYQMDMTKVDKRMGTRAVEGISCPACKGQGFSVGYRDVAAAKMDILQGRREFDQRQMVAGEVKLGRAYVAKQLLDMLPVRQRALVMTGMPCPCATCQLTGRQVCTTCRTTGWVKCDYRGCTQGVLRETTSDRSRRPERRLNEDSVNKCPKCEGLAEIQCTMCKGMASTACKKCDGSGLAPRCTRCTGTGLMPCSKCKGAGEVRGEPCAECKGELVMLCTTCRGEGAVAK